MRYTAPYASPFFVGLTLRLTGLAFGSVSDGKTPAGRSSSTRFAIAPPTRWWRDLQDTRPEREDPLRSRWDRHSERG
jgi:hypothetical protein